MPSANAIMFILTPNLTLFVVVLPLDYLDIQNSTIGLCIGRTGSGQVTWVLNYSGLGSTETSCHWECDKAQIASSCYLFTVSLISYLDSIAFYKTFLTWNKHQTAIFQQFLHELKTILCNLKIWISNVYFSNYIKKITYMESSSCNSKTVTLVKNY